ncbi:GxxExxY protein [Pedobacter segetis]|uniref:hypothetical protein n=1 Tax=Pedobacter segetis TaxID=2793069 RepID=UPI001909B87E|nr:hypothetical protein [Pedobacter segetis]
MVLQAMPSLYKFSKRLAQKQDSKKKPFVNHSKSVGEKLDVIIMTEDEISYKIRRAIFNVYYNLDPGLLENV